NLFVFFEVMLAASYGLVLHGSGPVRIRAGLHYIAINLTASLLFLIGVALIYGVTGTLNMAQIAHLSRDLGTGQRPLFHAGAAMLGLAFLIKAAIWPLGFWLPRTYDAAASPVAAVMTLMSKVGVYAVLRIALLCFAPGAGESAGFGGAVLMMAGTATMVYGALGVMASERLARHAGHIVLISSGTIIAVTGFTVLGGGARMLAGALFYMIGSTVAASALYLLAEMVERQEPVDEIDESGEPQPAPPDMVRGLEWGPMGLGAVEDSDEPATALPGSIVTVGALFAAIAAVLAGLPPFAGFLGKFTMVSGMFAAASNLGTIPPMVWVFVLVLLASGFAVLVSLLRFGINRFWVETENRPRVLVLEIVPVALLLTGIVLMTFQAEDVTRMTLEAADGLIEGRYAATVMAVHPVDPGATPQMDNGDVAP
ncbi:MAG TPA: proton-conducting transporter membrane subunit, partial [Paracoccus sp. (in: a-proteobacteria)]|nr:proton-conducting transporter membrane subunit [Paracoccus sp. (in: a-proteobacteria)]